MCDKLVFDLSQEIEGSPSVFIRKDWISMLDNQNQNYNSNQSILDTSQICNSNKYMSYREAYLSVPFVLTLGLTTATVNNATVQVGQVISPVLSTNSFDYSIGLKNWFGQIIHSFTLDYNGTTIIQQTPYVNMWNSFKLMTSMSLDDINVQGPTIGFFPDDSVSWQFIAPVNGANTGTVGNGTCNNSNLNTILLPTGQFNNFRSGSGNEGFIARQQLINFDLQGSIGQNATGQGLSAPLYQSTQYYGNLLFGGGYVAVAQGAPMALLANNGKATLDTLWKGYIYNKQNATPATGTGALYQVAVNATIYLKHIHSFFNFCPLIKGAFMKMTINLNNTTTEFACSSLAGDALINTGLTPVQTIVRSIQNPLGGVNPIMLASGSCIPNSATGVPTTYTQQNGSFPLLPQGSNSGANAGSVVYTYRLNISVGAFCLDQTLASIPNASPAPLSRSIYLYIPSYTFNPPFEQAYLSNPVKNIKYTDIYQYQVQNIIPQQTFSNLITNGIANIKSVLILPFYSSATGATSVPTGTIAPATSNLSANTGFLTGTPVWQSPFDPAGTGPTSPLCYIGNFNVQISGQNAIYNTEKYLFEQFNNQLYGQNAVNGGMTDGLNSGLVSRQAFDMCYNYYYVNVERMLPAEQSVPKSVQIIGQNLSSKALDFIVFVEFGVDTINIDILTGARV